MTTLPLNRALRLKFCLYHIKRARRNASNQTTTCTSFEFGEVDCNEESGYCGLTDHAIC
jgi:hypothetical protein